MSMRELSERFGPALITVLANLIVFAVAGTWWVGNVRAELATRIASTETNTANLTARVDKAEAATTAIKTEVIEELRHMRTEVNQRLDRIEDRIDRRSPR